MPNPRPPIRRPAHPTELPPGGSRRKRGTPFQLVYRDAANVRRYRYASSVEELWTLHRELGSTPEPVVEDRLVTFSRHSAAVLERKLRTGRLRERSADAYSANLAIANRYIGSKRLVAVTRTDVERMRDELLDAGELSPTTVREVVSLVGRMLRQAVRDGILERNVAEVVELPRRAEYRPSVPTPDDVALLLRTTAEDPLGPFWHLACMTGMRRGELLALRWSDVNLRAGLVTVNGSLSRLGIGPTKTSQSRRTIRLDGPTVAQLRRLGPGPDAAFVFARPDGRPLPTTTIQRELDRALARAGLAHCRVHDLRHAFAAVAIEADVPLVVVSAILGHSRLDMTADLYTHLTARVSEDAIAAVGERLSRPAGVRPGVSEAV